jgi:Fic family protein
MENWLILEAKYSNLIEGIESPTADSLYCEALIHGFNRIKNGFPICSRLIRELHEISVTDKFATPGYFRTTQNWIGGNSIATAIKVPPPPNKVDYLMGKLDNYINGDDILKVIVAHPWYETIHPFLDGNGRTGRMLISLMLFDIGFEQIPLSMYLYFNRGTYYNILGTFSFKEDVLIGDFNSWVKFFLDGVASTNNFIDSNNFKEFNYEDNIE